MAHAVPIRFDEPQSNLLLSGPEGQVDLHQADDWTADRTEPIHTGPVKPHNPRIIPDEEYEFLNKTPEPATEENGNYCVCCQNYFKKYFHNCDKCSMPKDWREQDPKSRQPIEFYQQKKAEKDARVAKSADIYNTFKAHQAQKRDAASGLVNGTQFGMVKGPAGFKNFKVF